MLPKIEKDSDTLVEQSVQKIYLMNSNRTTSTFYVWANFIAQL